MTAQLLREGDVDSELVCSLVLLAAHVQSKLPEELVAAFVRTPPQAARAVLSRLEELTGTEAFTPQQLEALRTRVDGVAARRAMLRQAREVLPRLLEPLRPSPQSTGEHVIFYVPHSDMSGAGAILPAVELTSLIEAQRLGQGGDGAGGATHGPLAGVAARGRLAVGPEAVAAEAVLVIEGIAVVPEPAVGAAAASTWVVPIVLAALSGFVLVGVVLSARAMRRERLAAQARSDFLTAVTHELKTPLASIRLLVDVLRDGRASEGQRAKYHRTLGSEAARLTMLVENVLDLGRLERGERAYDKRREEASDVVFEALELYEPLAARDGLHVELRPSAAPVALEVDRHAVVQVLLNLLENARRYAAGGSRVEVTTHVEGGRYFVDVRDFGPGIHASERDSVFEKFASGQAASDGGNPGVGLGLFLSRTIVHDHGGDLVVVEPPDGGGGACVRLSLPVAPEQVPRIDSAAFASQTTEPEKGLPSA